MALDRLTAGEHAPPGVRPLGWWGGTFGPASEEPYRRRTSDWVRLVAAALVMTALVRHAGDITDTEQAVFQFFNSLPNGLQTFFLTLYRVGALWAVGLVAAAALLTRRWRLARDLLLSGLLAWGTARALGEFVVEGRGVGRSLQAITRLGNTPSFPLVRLAVVCAVVAAAGPYVTRPARRVGQVLVVALGLAALYLGTASPNDAFGAIVLGWGIAAAVHLAFGSPGGRPTTPQVTASLAELGISARGLHLAPRQPPGSTVMLAQDDAGPLRVKVIGRDEADAQLLAKVWRFVAYRDSGPMFFLTRLQQVEHEAYVSLLAAHAGVRVPEVVIAGKAGPGTALLVERPITGTRLADVAPEQITDEVLDSLWQQVAALHRAHITHGALDALHVVLTEEGPALVNFRAATSAAPERSRGDIAELLVVTATLVGEEHAVAAAVRGVGRHAVAAALPLLQPAALTRQTRLFAGRKHDLDQRLDRLRELGARAAGIEAPSLQQLHRISGPSLLLAVGTLVAAAALLDQVGSPEQVWDTVKHADWLAVTLAFAISMATNLAFAVALMGTVPIRLPLWPTTELQVALSFSNLAVPAIGGAAVQIRFLQKQGMDLAPAVAAGGLLSTLANAGVALGLFSIALVLSPQDVHLGEIPTTGLAETALGIALFAGVVAGAVLGIPRLRRAVVPPVVHAASSIWAALSSPRRLTLLVLGNAATFVMFGACLLVCVEAFGGGSISFWTLLALDIGIETIAALVPIPGGGTAVGSVGLAGALIAFGLAKNIAVPAVLTYQLVVYYIPAVPGWFATAHLARRDYL